MWLPRAGGPSHRRPLGRGAGGGPVGSQNVGFLIFLGLGTPSGLLGLLQVSWDFVPGFLGLLPGLLQGSLQGACSHVPAAQPM